jgi:hypothetical protein
MIDRWEDDLSGPSEGSQLGTLQVDHQRSDQMSSLVQIPTDADQVTDPDEEVWLWWECPDFANLTTSIASQVFLLYTRLAAKSPTESVQGLGCVDSRSPVLNVNIELDLAIDQPTSHGNRRKGSKGSKPQKRHMAIEVELAQNPTSLRSRKGDTGSVLWRVR